ncbi:MAG: hypothetical protein ACUVS4_09520 [Chloroflexaceae bacterium]
MHRIPLTVEQQNALKSLAWLMVAVVGASVIGLGAILTCLLIASGNAPIVRVFSIVALTIALAPLGLVAWRVYNIALDLRDGAALVHTARLNRKFSSARHPKQFYAVFDTPVTLQISGEMWEPLQPERRYLLTYSPRSRMGWLVESLPEEADLE